MSGERDLRAPLIDLIAGTHVGTWFSTRGMRDRIVQTFAGVRPDVLFVVVLGHVLKGVQDELEWAGLLTQMCTMMLRLGLRVSHPRFREVSRCAKFRTRTTLLFTSEPLSPLNS